MACDGPPTVSSALRRCSTEFAAEMRLAAAIYWYSQEMVSQSTAAEIAGLGRAQFLEEPFRRKVPAIQVLSESCARSCGVNNQASFRRQRRLS